MKTVTVDYEEARKNNVRADAEKAIRMFLDGGVGLTFTIFPQALNPMLKAIESLGIWRQVVIVPHIDTNNKPTYIIIKIGNNSDKVTSISIGE